MKEKYFKNGKLKFDGEYLYNNRIKGKEYIKRILGYKGKYLDEKKWKGKIYYKNNNIICKLNLDCKLVF